VAKPGESIGAPDDVVSSISAATSARSSEVPASGQNRTVEHAQRLAGAAAGAIEKRVTDRRGYRPAHLVEHDGGGRGRALDVAISTDWLASQCVVAGDVTSANAPSILSIIIVGTPSWPGSDSPTRPSKYFVAHAGTARRAGRGDHVAMSLPHFFMVAAISTS
jgi:hypothetical protein